MLREVDEAAFYAAIPSLRKTVEIAPSCAIHFFSDNRIVDEEVGALKSGDFEEFKRLVIASGRSSAVNLQNVLLSSTRRSRGFRSALALIERQLSAARRVACARRRFAGTVQAYVPLDMLEGFRAKWRLCSAQAPAMCASPYAA